MDFTGAGISIFLFPRLLFMIIASDIGVEMILFVMFINAFPCVMGLHEMSVLYLEHKGQGPERKRF